jgi:A/G-specific adenine glycosylase
MYPAQAGDFTQALMELGATVCGPNRKPDCENCPCKDFCTGALHGTAENFPVKSPKKPRKVEEMTVFVLHCDGKFALQKRGSKGLLAGLWQFPNCPEQLSAQQALEYVAGLGCKPRDITRQVERQHIFTHIQWEMRGIYLEVDTCANGFVWLTAEEIQNEAALPTAFRQFWEEIDHV